MCHQIECIVVSPLTSVPGLSIHESCQCLTGSICRQHMSTVTTMGNSPLSRWFASAATASYNHTSRYPIPLPTKTPPHVRNQLLQLLRDIGHDLADMTPRRLLRHSLTQARLRQLLRSFIKVVKEKEFPYGTGWDGALAACDEMIHD